MKERAATNRTSLEGSPRSKDLPNAQLLPTPTPKTALPSLPSSKQSSSMLSNNLEPIPEYSSLPPRKDKPDFNLSLLREDQQLSGARPSEQRSDEMSDVLLDEYNVLRVSGILDAYEYFLKLLCKHGLPTGRVYDYAAQEIEKFEKRKITKELKMRAELDIQKITKKTTSSRVSPERTLSPQPHPSQ